MRKALRSLGCLMFVHRHHTRQDKLHLLEIRSLGLWGRLCHKKTHRHLCGLALGFGIMMVGVSMSWACEYVTGPGRMLLEMSAWFVHGVGACPFMGHLEPLWHVFSVTAEELA